MSFNSLSKLLEYFINQHKQTDKMVNPLGLVVRVTKITNTTFTIVDKMLTENVMIKLFIYNQGLL